MFDTDSPTDICGVGVQGGTLIEMTREMVKQIECDYWREKESPIDMAEIFDLAQKALEQEPRCKECKWWKDSDGEYRRGCGAESQCPINRKEVFEGNGYCFLFEPQESEEV